MTFRSIDFRDIFDRKIIITRIYRFNPFLMKALSSLVAATVLLTSCASQTPEQKRIEERRNKRAETVGSLVDVAGEHLGLNPLEKAMLGHTAQKIARDPDPVGRVLDEIEGRPDLRKKAQDWLERNPKQADQILNLLGQ
ncbi:hypothetical protein H6768_02345 [Candidatus Peribacteria bacterium]|nr:hypothetical protein [Candidatus Peribacteria bacterium]